MITALIVAAGSSQRMGFQKLAADLLGKPVLRWTLEAFDACPEVDDLIIVVGESTREMVLEWAEEGLFRKSVQISDGGAERHLSVYEGLQIVPEKTKLIAVHDGARPLITPKQIARCIQSARKNKAAACARPVTETLKRVDEQGKIVGSLDRQGAWLMETPQVFDRALLCAAYDHVVQNGIAVTDEVSAVQQFGADVFVLDNPEPNLKITYPGDLPLAEQILGMRP